MITGHILSGNPVTDNKFQGVTSLNQIENYGLKRPSMVENARSTDSVSVRKAKAMHDQMNRRFDASRLHRAVLYRDYIFFVEIQNQMGGTPAITLWFPDMLQETEDGVVIPYNSHLTAIDGETQLESRFMLRDGITPGKIGRTMLGEERDEVPESGNNRIAITLYHGVSIEHAQQILRDYNAEANPIDPKKASAYDHVGPLSKAITAAIAYAGVSPDKVNQRGAVAGKRYTVAYQQVLSGVAGFMLNGAKAEPVTLTTIRLMNRPTADEIPVEAIAEIGRVILDGQLSQAPAIVWQAVGHALSRGQLHLNYRNALRAYQETKMAGRGGPRMTPRDRLARIVAAL
jgi:hypothetical protein